MCEIDTPDEWSEVWAETSPTARKRHKCDCCGGFIEPGQKYTRVASLYDGSWAVEKSCAPCDLVREEFIDAHGSFRMVPSQFFDELQNCTDHEDEENAVWLPKLEAMNARRAA
jgi:hypothetical protein